MTVSYSGQKKGGKRNVKFRRSGTLNHLYDYQGSYPFSETNFQDFSRSQIDFSRALKFTLTPTLQRSQC